MTPLIGIDWGTSNCRAFRFAPDGTVVERREGACGIATVADGRFEDVLADLIAGWGDGAVPILLSGMIGSRNGWAEAPYLPCPATLDAIAAAAMPLSTRLGRAWIVPGLSHRLSDGAMDVMRGEETQLVGAGGDRDGLVVTPGTHSKWARIAGGRVAGFRSYMTGELFAVLRGHSILGRLMEPSDMFDAEAFSLGVTRALADPAITALLFGVRTEGLFAHLPPTGLGDYLSGLLLGAEVASGLAGEGARAAPVTIVAAPALAGRYRIALDLAGAPPPRVVEGDTAAARGLWTIGTHLLGDA